MDTLAAKYGKERAEYIRFQHRVNGCGARHRTLRLF